MEDRVNIFDYVDTNDLKTMSDKIFNILREQDENGKTLLEKYKKDTEQWLSDYMRFAEQSFLAKRGQKNLERIEIEKLLQTGLSIVENIRKKLMGEDIFYLMIELKDIPYITKKEMKNKGIKELNEYFDDFIKQKKTESIKLYIEEDITSFLKPSQGALKKGDIRKGKGILGDPIFNLNKAEIKNNIKKIQEAEKNIDFLNKLEKKLSEMELRFVSQEEKSDFTTYYENKTKIGKIKYNTSNRERYMQWLKIKDVPIESGKTFTYEKDGKEKTIKRWRKNKNVQWFAYSEIYQKKGHFTNNRGVFFEAYMHAINLEQHYKVWNLDDAFIAANGNLAFYKGPDTRYYEQIQNRQDMFEQYNFQQKIIDNASISGNTIFNVIVLLNSILTGEDWRDKHRTSYIPNPQYGPYNYLYYIKKDKQINIKMEDQLVALFSNYDAYKT